MGIRLEVGRDYGTTNGTRIRVLGKVSSDHIGRIERYRNGDKLFVPVPYFRCQFADTGEIVFYNSWGHVLSAEPTPSDKNYTIQKVVS